MFAIREIVRLRGTDAFSSEQKTVLHHWVDHILSGVDEWDRDDAFAESLPADLRSLKLSLGAD